MCTDHTKAHKESVCKFKRLHHVRRSRRYRANRKAGSLLDLHMPVMCGLEAARQLRIRETLPIVMLTADASKTSRQTMVATGVCRLCGPETLNVNRNCSSVRTDGRPQTRTCIAGCLARENWFRLLCRRFSPAWMPPASSALHP